jgi:nucleotide-binding universal stress UspA family protein
MKKILVVFSGTGNPTHVLHFALAAARQNGYILQGIFLDELPSARESYPFPNDLALTEEEVTAESIEQENEELLADYTRYMEDECRLAGVPYSIEKKVPVKKLDEYMAAAHLIALDTRADFENTSLIHILTHAHCPVCLVAITAPKVETIIFAFDGSEGSKYAIRKFTELFPHLGGVKIYLVSVNAGEEIIENKEFVNEWVGRHFQNVTIHPLEGNEKEVFVDFLQQFPDNALVVMGAFGRSALSRLIHPSFAGRVLHKSRASLFLAHP